MYTDLLNIPRKELLVLLEETERWTSVCDSKFFLYHPNPVMRHFHSSPAKCRVILGGNRSGKTYACIIEAISQFLGQAPRSIASNYPINRLDQTRRIRYCTIDYPNNFEKVVWPYIQQLVPSEYISDVVKEQGRIKSITNKKGGFIEFMQYEQDVRKFQGSSRHAIFYDEEPPLSIRDENLMRLVDTDGEEIFGMTPVSEIDRPVLWIYDVLFSKAGRVVEKVNNNISDATNPEGDSNIHIFFANIYDNYSINKEAANRILSRFPEEERIVREQGKFMFFSGLIYKYYSDDTHLFNNFDSWKWDDDYTLYIAIDPHPRTPHAVSFLCAHRNGNMYYVDEIFQHMNPREMAHAIKAKISYTKNGKLMIKQPEVIIIDPSAFVNDMAENRCFAYDLADEINAVGIYLVPIPASKDLSYGIIKVNEALHPGETGVPRLKINRSCTRFRFEITHYIWDSWKKDTSMVKGPKQKPVDKDDHMMENLYRLVLLNPVWIPIDDIDDTKRRVN